MKKIVTSLFLIICLLMLNFCVQNENESIFANADYDAQTNTIKIDYQTNPDTSLLQIIAYSNIRHSGYGLLLNINNAYSKSELAALKLKFQKLDINAIHSYDYSLSDTLPLKTRVAIEGAKFVWLLGNSNNDWKSKPIDSIINSIQDKTEYKVLIVSD